MKCSCIKGLLKGRKKNQTSLSFHGITLNFMCVIYFSKTLTMIVPSCSLIIVFDLFQQNFNNDSSELFLDILTKEEKEALLSKKMEAIRKKNEVLQKRHEVNKLS